MAGGYTAEGLPNLRAATGMAEGDLLYCNETRFTYEYFPSLTDTEFLPWVVESNVAGRWVVTGQRTKVLPITDANTITPNYSLSQNFSILMAGNRATRLIATPINLIDGMPISIRLRQPASPPSGGCKITVSSGWKIVNNDVSINPAANSFTLIQGMYYQDESIIIANIIPV